LVFFLDERREQNIEREESWEGIGKAIIQKSIKTFKIREKSDLFSARQIYTASVMATKGRCLLCSSRETYPS
jgi:hypothetical protein